MMGRVGFLQTTTTMNYWREIEMNRMDSKKKHPFAITCRKCGSNRVTVRAFDNHDLDIKCKNCGFLLNCGYYDTEENDYSDM